MKRPPLGIAVLRRFGAGLVFSDIGATAAGKPFGVRLDRLSGTRFIAHWFDPCTGAATPAGEHAVIYQKTFTPSARGKENDWVLVLDKTAHSRPTPPGTCMFSMPPIFAWPTSSNAVSATATAHGSGTTSRVATW